MTKTRIEMLSDGVFAIVMTLLVLDLRVPDGAEMGDKEVLKEIFHLGPRFVIYFVSFAVLAMFWSMHHAMFHLVLKAVNRLILVPALFYLCFLSLVPFSAHLLGSHPHARLAVIVYGLNVLAINAAHTTMFLYGSRHPELANPVPRDVMRQARRRQWVVPACTALGMIASTFSIRLALVLYAVPVPFNLLPGLLGLSDRIRSRGSAKG